MTNKSIEKKALPEKLTIKAAKESVIKQELEIPLDYDKRFLNTWLHILGYNVDPIKKKAIVHKPKKEIQKLNLSELNKLAEEMGLS